jgi:hypothetical protein
MMKVDGDYRFVDASGSYVYNFCTYTNDACDGIYNFAHKEVLNVTNTY